MLLDDTFLQFTRGVPCAPLRSFDTDRAGDVSLCMLWLYTLARTIYARSILEIGCADGSTTLPLLKAAEENNGNVQSVDMHNCEIAQYLVDACGYREFWSLYEKGSDSFFSTCTTAYDLVFIDGDHSAVAVEKDLLNSWQHLAEGGYVVLHDWSPAHPSEYWRTREDPMSFGVGKAVQKCLPFLGKYVMLPVTPVSRPGMQKEEAFLVIHKPRLNSNAYFECSK